MYIPCPLLFTISAHLSTVSLQFLDACYELNFGNQDAFVATVLESASVDRKSFAYYAVSKVAGVSVFFTCILLLFLFFIACMIYIVVMDEAEFFYCMRQDCKGKVVNLQDKKEKVKSAMKQAQGVLQTIEERKVDELNAACSFTEFAAIRQMATDLNKNLETILNCLQRTESLISCEALTPIYKKITSESLCTYSVVFFAWTFSCLTIASFFGTMMITFRSSWKFDTAELNNSNGTFAEKNANSSNASHKISNDGDSEVWSSRMSNIQDTNQSALESSQPQVGTSSLEEIATNLTSWDWDWNKPSMKTKDMT